MYQHLGIKLKYKQKELDSNRQIWSQIPINGQKIAQL